MATLVSSTHALKAAMASNRAAKCGSTAPADKALVEAEAQLAAIDGVARQLADQKSFNYRHGSGIPAGQFFDIPEICERV